MNKKPHAQIDHEGTIVAIDLRWKQYKENRNDGVYETMRETGGRSFYWYKRSFPQTRNEPDGFDADDCFGGSAKNRSTPTWERNCYGWIEKKKQTKGWKYKNA